VNKRVREWKFRDRGTPSASDGALTDSATSDAVLDRLKVETGLSELTLRVCQGRGLVTSELIQGFLAPKLEALADPNSIRDMGIAVERISRARENHEPVLVFGDYDVDGTTGSALLSWFFTSLGLDFTVEQPDRFKDGYGLNVGAVERAAERGVRVLVTVDCGITSFEPAKRARELGIDLIIVDHHQVDPQKGLPEACAVVNPQRSDCSSGLKQLCGCGLAFYFARALRTFGKSAGWWSPGEEPNLKQHLDLVVMATAADLVPLTGDNHILVKHGLEVLKNTKKPGVRALLQAAGVSLDQISPGHLGFVIGPRINASGRMGSADRALELLTTTDASRAMTVANELEKVNRERAELQNRIWDQVRAQIEEGLAAGKYQHGILVFSSDWHEGVVGIVASRVTESFKKPAAIIAIREGKGKGSVRSYGGKNVLEALRQCSDLLLTFGGHQHAAGLSAQEDLLEQLSLRFDQAIGDLVEDESLRPLFLDGVAKVSDLDVKTMREIESLGPFGPGNPEPLFEVTARAPFHQVLKGRHLKLGLTSERSQVEAIWFNAAESAELLEPGVLEQDARWAGIPELNRFRGRTTPTLRIRDRQPLDSKN
jgi:single-stranded-DNA-specific exonuclease